MYYPFGSDVVFTIDVLNCFCAPSQYVYKRLNSDWVKMLTLDIIKDTKFEEILGIVMPCDEHRNNPLQKFSEESINSATY